ncbi:hypothetical protein GQ457_07G024010 [Hibiscus cannabinus]
MEEWPFHDGNVLNLLENRHIDIGHDVVGHSLQMHSSLIRRLSMEQELKDATQTITNGFLLCSLFEQGHQGCVNAVAWNSDGSLLISGSDDERVIFFHMMLVEIAKRSLDEGTNIFHAIEACNEVLDGHGSDIGPTLRSALLLKWKWKNARRIDSSSFRAHHLMGEVLEQDELPIDQFIWVSKNIEIVKFDPQLMLGKHKEALDFAVAAQCLSPYDTMAAEKVENRKKKKTSCCSSLGLQMLCISDALSSLADAEKNNKASDGACRVLSLTGILYRSEANSDVLQDGPRSEREDSDFDEELELDFETSMSEFIEEAIQQEKQVHTAYVDLDPRLHKMEWLIRFTFVSLPKAAIDMKQSSDHGKQLLMTTWFWSACNFGNIMPSSWIHLGEFVASGSDDGRWFIWEKQTGRLIKMLLGDDAGNTYPLCVIPCRWWALSSPYGFLFTEKHRLLSSAVVKCVQCHPFDCFVATSGIDNTIKVSIGFMGRVRWFAPSVVAGGSAGPEAANVFEAMESNQRKLFSSRETFL